jgi:hypothetical protein
MKSRRNVIPIATREARLRRQVREHLHSLGFTKTPDGLLAPPALDKPTYRKLHEPQRLDRLVQEARFVDRVASDLIGYFANGTEVNIDNLDVRIELIDQQCWQSDLFRFAAMSWSVPVSYGFGRRMRYLVWDENSKKLIGLFALGDPVFNLRARDQWVGWSAADRTKRLVYMLDGYVIGAMPPFSNLLGGKLVASLMRTKEVVADFRARYGHTKGIISGDSKNAHLVAITTTSALGRSSVYNRVRLGGVDYLTSLGYTGGFGHFHFPNGLFDELRSYLKRKRHSYADSHQFGDGPNWRLRTIRQALRQLDLDPDLIRHGLSREVFVSRVADNAVDVLNGTRKRPKYESLLSVQEVATAAIARWLKPRSQRDESFRAVRREQLMDRVRSTVGRPNSSAIRAKRA